MDPKNEKIRMDLLPLPALQQVAVVMQLGASKYGEWNFRGQPVDAQVYTGAILRHLTKIQQGEENDAESGVSHWAHIAANALIMMSGTQIIPQSKIVFEQNVIQSGGPLTCGLGGYPVSRGPLACGEGIPIPLDETEIPFGQRVRKNQFTGTIIGKTGEWYHIEWDDGKRHNCSNYWGTWEFELEK